MKYLIAVSAILLLFTSSCKKSENNTNNPVNPAVAPVSAKINGTLQTWNTPPTFTDTTSEMPVDTDGTAFWVATEDTIALYCAKKIGTDTVFMFIQAKMPASKEGTYNLAWRGVNIDAIDNSNALPFKCFYGKFNDILPALSPRNNTPAEMAAYPIRLANYNATGTLTVTSFTNNKLSGTFNFATDIGTNLQFTVTEGKFTNVNKGLLF